MTVNPERIQSAGEVITETIEITSRGRKIDIKAFVVQTVIYEDMFNNVMTGHLTILDAANFITQLPISGIETVTLSFRTPGFKNERIKKTFYITAVSERSITEKEQGYVLNLISEEALVDNTSFISKKFSGKSDEVVKQVFTEYLAKGKQLIAEKQTTDVALVSPYWSPLKVINWIANRSYREVPNTLFYEGNKFFHYKSVDYIVKTEKTFATYSYTPANTVETYKNFVDKYYSINKIGGIQFLDVFKAQDSGYYASNLVTHDIGLKQYKELNYDFYNNKSNIVSLETGKNTQLFPSNIPRNPYSMKTVRTKQYAMFDEMLDPKYENWVLQRNSLLYEMGNLRFTIEVPGRTDIEVGKIIECLIPKSLAKPDGAKLEDYLDPYLSGRYLITSIRHQFTLNNHEMILELAKDSFKKSLG